MAEVFGEFYVDTTTGRQQVPQYDAWFKWTKFGTNIASAVLAVGTGLAQHRLVLLHIRVPWREPL